ncbi:MAG TPA: alpha/beta hydrolase, partial [Candidatus Rokubacteria bacterium]|nr:alpha/beta hydrolase [Candidatus Rokubacteria bacterium]
MPELQRPAGPLHYEITDLPLAIAREIHALVPGSELQEFPGLRHAIAY